MGKNNKARRAAKAKAKAKARARSRSGDDSAAGNRSRRGQRPPQDDTDRTLSDDDRARYCLLMAADTRPQHAGKVGGARRQLDSLRAEVVHGQAEQLLLSQTDAIWAGGWQPSELLRQGKRACSAATAGRLVGWVIAADHASRRSTTLDGRWVNQVDSLDLPTVTGRPGWIRAWADDEGLAGSAAISAIVDALSNLNELGPLDPLLPPPGADRSDADSPWSAMADRPAGAESDPVLERIRALLAKAESSVFEAEATAFTAKAQELMTRHAIDAAIVAGGENSTDEKPVMIRVPIDAPYIDAKSLLLQTVAVETRCRSVFHDNVAMSTVAGFAVDVAAVELLFTSLLLQAQTALADAAKRAPAGARTRSQSYRSAFLVAYTNRIGERLREINEAVYAEVEADQGAAFLPVLRSRSDEVNDFVGDHFGELESSPVRAGWDMAGRASGKLAADNARLNSGDITDNRPARGLPVGASGP